MSSNNQIIKPENYLVGNANSKHSVLEKIIKELATNKLLLIPYRKGNKWGFCDKNKNIVIDCIYDDADPFDVKQDGYAKVVLNKQWHWINKKGEKKYESDLNPSLTPFAENGKWGYRNQDSTIIVSPKYDKTFEIHNGHGIYQFQNKFGFIDERGAEITQPSYDKTLNFKNGYAPVELNNKWGLIDTAGNEVIKCQYENVGNFSNELDSVVLNNKIGFIDKNDFLIIDFKYDKKSDITWGDGREIFVMPEFQSNGLVKISLNDKFGCINKKGEIVCDINYSRIKNFENNIAVARLNNKWGLINNLGDVILDFISQYELYIGDGLVHIEEMGNSSSKYYGLEGNLKIEIECDYSSDFSEGLAGVNINEKWGFINKRGEFVISCKYEDVLWFENGLSKVTLMTSKIDDDSEFWIGGYIDKNGTEFWED